MGEMNTYANDEVGAWDCLDGESPEVHHAGDVDHGEDDAQQNLDATNQVGEQGQGRHEDAGERQRHVTVQLLGDDL